ncbi:MAG: riboflavin synthase [Flavobacteriales bacterium]|nr:riboflavin synthase [Flavobacteriales bacterium]
MFTGIIETLGTLTDIRDEGTNRHFTVSSSLSDQLKVDQSVAHDGVCLTVVDVQGDQYTVTAVEETLTRTNLGQRRIGDKMNLERCTKVGDRLDGHIVQGHVDTTAKLVSCDARDGSWNLAFSHGSAEHHLTVQKGSITVNGVSLTVVDAGPEGFSVTVIPYTWEHTGFHALQVGDSVNLEFDIVGKYVAEMMSRRG